ncbi:3D-(3,5/4)-trihydroxycyclohexane-1,2-dione hydrolase [Actinoplanes sp. SE50]|uniref:3D-(3,5/4)-trihydroxycyclohexane-1,2-dione acylhydrolase (decyclizing) n=1 Tax=unclassified Actinoplanes TaxID=2626549 RepID=UPI00023ECE6A|nr:MULTISPECIES: 3D-(3,5/4)-trihydroxycyclohexane-1,2-dione acylhydrolase (decyclizing) [unclassified Actinoplanes]AEV83814.1 3D-(3,5/4)-trihydroxycyclohexane-1, 2-dione hydrolase [Actinoplanes sp. SE50/110]ATO82042.1 3D-(3,5/4)-trihydroxycyclohexane-1,2-dione hydrolase [Actinoplanes sp. SE50]SLL99450.1 3D-(3,5/4)-trihydroxycyclohexane-1,2-dione acylhydrolase (decyclizing) [Actinoplanes sp. SE50/110]
MKHRLTVAQAAVRFLANQFTERDGIRERAVAGFLGIFGHGNVAGIGQALVQAHRTGSPSMPYRLARNEQAMVHTAVGYARMRNRLSTMACTASIGPGSTNMLTGAALATISRIPVLLLPSDVFATRVATPVLQELEDPRAGDVSVNDAFRPLSKFFDRVWRPEQLPAALLGAMRVLTDPAETGAVTVCLPQDVQIEAYEWPDDLFAERVWHITRPVPDPLSVERAAAVIRGARRPLIVAGGGVIYSEASAQLDRFARETGIPVADTQAGKGALSWDHPNEVGGIGATGSPVANRLAGHADVVIGIGTRYSDFTTASRTAFRHPHVRFVNLNVTSFDAGKLAALPLVADARAGLQALRPALHGRRFTDEFQEDVAGWNAVVAAHLRPGGGLPTQAQVIGVVNDACGARDVVVQAAGSLPGDLQRLWRSRDPKQYQVEYGYSCMGFEIAGALGIKLADPSREVFALVGDGSYLMMAQEIVTAIAEGVKLIVILVQNHGFASIGALSEQVGSQRFGTSYRYRSPQTGDYDGALLPVDLALNAESLGAAVIRCRTTADLAEGLKRAREHDHLTLLHIETDPLAAAPSSEAWWDVPVAEVATLHSTRHARAAYLEAKRDQRPHLRPGD